MDLLIGWATWEGWSWVGWVGWVGWVYRGALGAGGGGIFAGISVLSIVTCTSHSLSDFRQDNSFHIYFYQK